MQFRGMHNLIKKLILVGGVFTVLLFFVVAFAPDISFAQADTFGLSEIDDNVNLGGEDIRTTIAKIIRAALGLLGVIVLGVILYAGFMIMTSAGNEEKVAQGKKTLMNAVVGLLIIMSAFAITQFVINKLAGATGSGQFGAGNGNGAGGNPNFQTFAGSGSLGRIITDHYPESGQTGVPRNAKIFVTFAEPIVPSSLIENTNMTCWPTEGNKPVPYTNDNNGQCRKTNDIVDEYFGDCTDINGDGSVTMETECDRVISDAVQIATTAGVEVESVVALAAYNAERQASTFTFAPLTLLGSGSENVWHRVILTNKIQKRTADGAVNVFSGQRSDYYTWQFETSDKVDLDPPYVLSTLPKAGQTIARNSIIRVTFNEPMDPIAVQGMFTSGSSFTNVVLQGNGLSTDASNPISGEWKIVNGYKTIEFISSESCGENSCGGTMYCLPVACAAGDEACTMPMGALVRTAEVQNAENGFGAVPFTGVTDAAGNALDNGPENKPDGVVAQPPRPTASNVRVIGADEQAPDNYYWTFTVKNSIDRSIPYIENIQPSVDAQGVLPNDPVHITFSRDMMYSSLKNISIEEYAGEEDTGMDSLWFKAGAEDNAETGKTTVTLKHREFGPNGLALYYLPQIPSTVMSTNQNCMHPGYGPITSTKGESPTCTITFTESGDIGTVQNCTSVSGNAEKDTGCATTNGQVGSAQKDIASCLTEIKKKSPVTSQ